MIDNIVENINNLFAVMRDFIYWIVISNNGQITQKFNSIFVITSADCIHWLSYCVSVIEFQTKLEVKKLFRNKNISFHFTPKRILSKKSFMSYFNNCICLIPLLSNIT